MKISRNTALLKALTCKEQVDDMKYCILDLFLTEAYPVVIIEDSSDVDFLVSQKEQLKTFLCKLSKEGFNCRVYFGNEESVIYATLLFCSDFCSSMSYTLNILNIEKEMFKMKSVMNEFKIRHNYAVERTRPYAGLGKYMLSFNKM